MKYIYNLIDQLATRLNNIWESGGRLYLFIVWMMSGKQLLILAAKDGDYSAVEELLAAGADVNACDKKGRSALMLALENGHYVVASKLMAANANVNAYNN